MLNPFPPLYGKPQLRAISFRVYHLAFIVGLIWEQVNRPAVKFHLPARLRRARPAPSCSLKD